MGSKRRTSDRGPILTGIHMPISQQFPTHWQPATGSSVRIRTERFGRYNQIGIVQKNMGFGTAKVLFPDGVSMRVSAYEMEKV